MKYKKRVIELGADVAPVDAKAMKKRIEKGIYGLEPFQVVVTAATDDVVNILSKQIIMVDLSSLLPEEDDDIV